jgi:hypothetical protein
MTCWFEPLILRLGPAHHVIELIRRDQLYRARGGGTSLSGFAYQDIPYDVLGRCVLFGRIDGIISCARPDA